MEETKKYPTPMEVIRKKCLWCCNDQPLEVKLCPAKKCPLQEYKTGKKPNNGKSPLKAIKVRCLDCSGYEYNDVKYCTDKGCALYPFRLGHNPNRKGIGRKDIR